LYTTFASSVIALIIAPQRKVILFEIASLLIDYIYRSATYFAAQRH
jgi:hypothetical protein